MSQDSKAISSNDSQVDSAELRLRKAIALKDHAVSKGITVSKSILELLNEAECATEKHNYLCTNGVSVKIDQAISELTNFTYPTTGDTLIAQEDPEQKKRIEGFKQRLPLWLLVAAIGFATAYFLLRSNPPQPSGHIVLAASLGLLGSVMFQIFNTIGVIKEKAFAIEDIYSNRLRIYIGPVIGILFYFVVTQGALTQGGTINQRSGCFVALPRGLQHQTGDRHT